MFQVLEQHKLWERQKLVFTFQTARWFDSLVDFNLPGSVSDDGKFAALAEQIDLPNQSNYLQVNHLNLNL